MVRARTVGALMLAVVLAGLPARPQVGTDTGEIRGLRLGRVAKSMATDGFGEFACGSNGGPPRQRLEDWSEFAKCRPEANGLSEVYARFDDEQEFIGRATEDPRYGGVRGGTRL